MLDKLYSVGVPQPHQMLDPKSTLWWDLTKTGAKLHAKHAWQHRI